MSYWMCTVITMLMHYFPFAPPPYHLVVSSGTSTKHFTSSNCPLGGLVAVTLLIVSTEWKTDLRHSCWGFWKHNCGLNPSMPLKRWTRRNDSTIEPISTLYLAANKIVEKSFCVSCTYMFQGKLVPFPTIQLLFTTHYSLPKFQAIITLLCLQFSTLHKTAVSDTGSSGALPCYDLL